MAEHTSRAPGGRLTSSMGRGTSLDARLRGARGLLAGRGGQGLVSRRGGNHRSVRILEGGEGCRARAEVPSSKRRGASLNGAPQMVSPSDWVRDGFCPGRLRAEPETLHSWYPLRVIGINSTPMEIHNLG